MADPAEAKLDRPVPGVPGAVICEAPSLPDFGVDGVPAGPMAQARPSALLFEVPGIARYLVENGRKISVAREPGADPSAVELFLESARGTLIHQRGELALAATTIMSPKFRSVAICGPSSFGKSAIAAMLCRRGWLLLADGITRVTWNGSAAIAWPCDSALKLWNDTCEAAEIDPTGLTPVRHETRRFFAPVRAATTPAALSAIVRLRLGNRAGVASIPARMRAAVVLESSHKPRQIDPMGLRAAHARIVASVANAAGVLGLDGARNAPLVELANVLERSIP